MCIRDRYNTNEYVHQQDSLSFYITQMCIRDSINIFSLLLIALISLFHHTPLSRTSLVLSFSLGYVFADFWELTTCKYLKLNGVQVFGGVHYHHSVFSFVGLTISLLTFPNISWLWILWSIGVFVPVSYTHLDVYKRQTGSDP